MPVTDASHGLLAATRALTMASSVGLRKYNRLAKTLGWFGGGEAPHTQNWEDYSERVTGELAFSAGWSCSCIADLKPRIPSPIPLPNSGSFLGPNTSKAIPAHTQSDRTQRSHSAISDRSK